MFISEDEAKARLSNPNNLVNRLGSKAQKKPEPIEKATEVCEPPETDQEEEPTLEDISQLQKLLKPTSATRYDKDQQEELFQRRLHKEKGNRGGRFTGTTNIPPIFQELIGTATQVKSGRYAGESFGRNAVHAHHLSKGRHHNASEVDQDLLSKIELNTHRIRDQVLGVLTNAVAGITPAALENKDAKELSIIAKNLSSILSSTKPPADFGDKNVNAQVVVFTPEQDKTTESYETVEVN